MLRSSRSGSSWLATIGRCLLSGVWFVAGWPKFVDPEGAHASVAAYRILPQSLTAPFAYALPMVELSLAVLLLLGWYTKASAVATAGMMLMFISGIAWAWAHGLALDCGCFGTTGTAGTDPVAGYVRDILRDGFLLLSALMLVRHPRSALAVDEYVTAGA